VLNAILIFVTYQTNIMGRYRKHPDGSCNHQIGFSVHEQRFLFETSNKNSLMESAKNFIRAKGMNISRKRLESLFRLKKGDKEFVTFFRYCPVCGDSLKNPIHLTKPTNHFKNYKKR